MRSFQFFLLFFFLIAGCNNNTQTNYNKGTASKENEIFFPVTDFLKGQIAEIKEKGVTPIRYFIKGNIKDSSWLNMKELEQSFSEFLIPEIDSLKLHQYYSVKKFYDQTLDQITLTYEANKDIPENVNWLSWNIYIDPEKGTVDRIYLVKRTSENLTTQLTWIPYKYCKIVNINDDGKTAFVESESKINWDY